MLLVAVTAALLFVSTKGMGVRVVSGATDWSFRYTIPFVVLSINAALTCLGAAGFMACAKVGIGRPELDLDWRFAIACTIPHSAPARRRAASPLGRP